MAAGPRNQSLSSKVLEGTHIPLFKMIAPPGKVVCVSVKDDQLQAVEGLADPSVRVASSAGSICRDRVALDEIGVEICLVASVKSIVGLDGGVGNILEVFVSDNGDDDENDRDGDEFILIREVSKPACQQSVASGCRAYQKKTPDRCRDPAGASRH
jgi:hypothetical protein